VDRAGIDGNDVIFPVTGPTAATDFGSSCSLALATASREISSEAKAANRR
jgi:hypothetical protein